MDVIITVRCEKEAVILVLLKKSTVIKVTEDEGKNKTNSHIFKWTTGVYLFCLLQHIYI